MTDVKVASNRSLESRRALLRRGSLPGSVHCGSGNPAYPFVYGDAERPVLSAFSLRGRKSLFRQIVCDERRLAAAAASAFSGSNRDFGVPNRNATFRIGPRV